jgi:DNA-binding transcriptional LysR family regulator
MAMELTDLALFLEVAQQGSFSRAAGVLRLAQPSVSTRIAALERTVGLPLFARSTRGVTLTAAGRALEPYARRCVALAEEGRRSARTAAGSSRLVMAAPPSLAADIFPPLIAALATEPLELSCQTAHSHEVVEQLADGAVHVGFLLGTAVPDGITARRLYQVPIVTVSVTDHPAVSHARRLSDLAAYRLAIHSWGPGASELDELLRAAGVPASQVCWVSPATTALTLAAEHGYVAVLSADAAYPGLRGGVLSRVKIANLPHWSMEVAVAYRRGLGEQYAPLMIEVLTETRRQIATALSG